MFSTGIPTNIVPTNTVSVQNGAAGAGILQGGSESSWSQVGMHRLIAMRLHVEPFERMPFHHISCCRLDKDVAVFVVRSPDSEPVVLRDGAELFPSDQLITQLRLIK